MAANFRLSLGVVPADYDVCLTPDIPKKVFSGYELVTFKENEKSDFAELFADKSITITSVTQDGKALEFTHVNDRVVIKGSELAKAPVRIEFNGSLGHSGVGFYYVNDECASTQFEATHARKAIPCFDEPTVKSTFKITIKTLNKLQVLSNMPIERTVTEGEFKTTSFFRTPPMCAYLLAIVIGHFDRLSGFTKRGLPVDVYAALGKAEFLEYPLAEAIKAIDWYEEFIQVNFPLPRLQLVAVPNVAYGAMENFGLLIHRDTALLAKKGVTSEAGLKRAALVISHELAHQWCGDGVSPRWWSSVWLNEGFASIFPYLQFCDTHPEWDNWADFEVGESKAGFSMDASEHTHAVDVPVNSDEEIESIFDHICYSKAACVIRMLMHYVGIEKMRDVLRVYFAKFMYANADTDDLCKVFSEVVNEDMKPFFNAWTLQSGFPLVILEEDLTIRQTRFTTAGTVDDRTWLIPLDILYSKDGQVNTKRIVFDQVSTKFDVEGCDWIKLNTGNHVFCRAWHKGKWADALMSAIEDGKLGTVDKYCFLSDTEALASAGILTSADLVKVLRGYTQETAFLTASQVVSVLNSLYITFGNERALLSSFSMKILNGILNKIGSDGNGQVCAIVYRTLIRMGDKDAMSLLVSMFDKYVQTGELDASLVMPVLMAAAKAGKISELKHILDVEVNPEIKQNAVRAMGCAPIDMIDGVIDDYLTNGIAQDMSPFAYGISEVPENTHAFWNYLKNNFDKVNAKYGTLAFLLPAFVNVSAYYSYTEEEADDLEKFREAHPGTIIDRSLLQAAAEARVRASLSAKESDLVRKELSAV